MASKSGLAYASRKIQHYYSVLGTRGVLAFLCSKALSLQFVMKRRIPGIQHPVFVRVASTDLSVLKQVLIEQHYQYALPTAPKVIIDAGANIGLAAIFFANRYPNAKIFSLEPEHANYLMLQKNVSFYPQIEPIQAALWWRNADLVLVDSGGGSDGFQTRDDSEATHHQLPVVAAMTVDSVMMRMGVDFIDILKIDIEGSEKEVFEHAASWIDRVGSIFVELHDHLQDGSSAAFTAATHRFRRETSNGEVAICVKPQIAGGQAEPSSAPPLPADSKQKESPRFRMKGLRRMGDRE